MSIPVIPSYSMPPAAAMPANRVQWQPEAARAVLLIHDMQDYFLRFYGADNPLLADLIANIAAIRAWAKAAGIPVVYTAQPSEQSAQDRALLNDMWGPGLTTADPALKAVTAALAPDGDDTVLVKWRYSAFQRSPLQQMMQDWRRDQLLIVGVYAHIGCMTTALDAFMRDIQPFLVGDAVADFSAAEHAMAFDYVAGRCGAVLTTAQLLARPALSRAWLKTLLQEHIDAEEGEFDGDDNLMDFGLDSLQVMSLVAEWKKHGLTVKFEELAVKPTLNAWWDLLAGKLAA
ncbi:isochorismatase family protein [Janthinobacterium sp.]|uniref:isochorismatase family protein n=1 Tax=Janthinobacterium sp. TaxID=1871054 RepID=UPI00293D90F4|nr:isochorismatase family protein [Janthinobacterium sp.]